MSFLAIRTRVTSVYYWILHHIVRPEDYTKVKRGDNWLDVLEITFRMSANTTCHLYRSCDKVPEAQMMASNGQGFLQFQVII